LSNRQPYNASNQEISIDIQEWSMKVVIIPGPTDLKAVVDPEEDMKKKVGSLLIPGMYDDWPEARESGFTEIDINGDTLRALLVEISNRLNRGGVDQGPMCFDTNDVKQSFEILVNEKNYVLISHGLDTRLQCGDEVTILEDVIGFC
jgi:hypothetical protein